MKNLISAFMIITLTIIFNACEVGVGPDGKIIITPLIIECQSVEWTRIKGKIYFTRINKYYTPYKSSLYLADGDNTRLSEVKYAYETIYYNLACTKGWNRIAYSRNSSITNNQWKIYTYGIYDCVTSSFSNVNADMNFPAFSKSGKIACLVNAITPEQTRRYELWIDNKLFLSGYPLEQTRSSFSPDEKHLLFSTYDTTSKGILYRVNLADKQVTQLINKNNSGQNAGLDIHIIDPVYSPDGSQIAFCKKWIYGYYNFSEIWVMNSDGANIKRMTNSYIDTYPAWSPDGAKIAFTRGEVKKLYIMESDGSDLTKIMDEEVCFPVWTN
jgi:Tol biopolymer transport system component